MATTDPSVLPGEPVAPDQAQGAQIPLQSFNVPEFPQEAQGLKALTLTADIKMTEYQEELSKSWSIPPLPQSIESLTLELFSMGYPAGFLTALAERLPNLKSLVIYSQLFAGITDKSQKDAIAAFKIWQNLRALHLLDVFAKPHFFESIAPWVTYNTSDEPGEARRGLMFLEINYTFRHSDEDFMGKIQAPELPMLIGPGLISCSFNLAEPETAEDDPDDPMYVEGQGGKEGIMAFNKSLADPLVQALTDEKTGPKGLRALNTTLYTLTAEMLNKVLSVQKNTMVLQATAEVEPGEHYKKKLLKALEPCKDLEQVEIIANPSLQFFMEVQNPRSGVMAKTFPSAEDLETLSKKCEKLSAFKANVLRTTSMGSVEWERKDGGWDGGVKLANGVVATGQVSM
ncbi:hypothetical protein DOTSEDRAFT_75620 [Dothistroma septosporum NZE10]|uniref:Uncharacterized protein n=1 Tax=Dothistroma septosporum (strain NZE10 / CBS 128990) TaxID=675120 RepID=M2XHQ1_DOTSN|nr:hypothetical protein DOTSEDRAFT_75620 [Dothistroma septosporum NZE10]